MPRPAVKVYNGLEKHLRSLEITRSRMVSLEDSNSIERRDLEQLCKGLFLDVVSSFEKYLETLFIGLFISELTAQSAKPVAVIKPKLFIYNILFTEKKYLDWLPYDKTEKRAKKYFKDGKPFTNLTNGEKDQLEEIVKIRNALAHKSKYALSKFKEDIANGDYLTPREKTPEGFLTSIYRRNPDQTQFEIRAIFIQTIAYKLCQ